MIPTCAVFLGAGFAVGVGDDECCTENERTRPPVQPITGADLSPDGKNLLIECYGGIYEVALPSSNVRDLTQDQVLQSRRQLPAAHLGQVRKSPGFRPLRRRRVRCYNSARWVRKMARVKWRGVRVARRHGRARRWRTTCTSSASGTSQRVPTRRCTTWIARTAAAHLAAACSPCEPAPVPHAKPTAEDVTVSAVSTAGDSESHSLRACIFAASAM